MSLPDLNISKGSGGLQRDLPNEDHYSGILFYKPSATALPTGYGTDRVKQITSIADAESKGILGDSGNYRALHYHVDRFFKKNPDAALFVYIDDEPVGAYDFAKISNLQDFADGKLRQIGVFVSSEAFDTAHVTALQGAMETIETNNRPAVALLQGDFSAVVDLTALDDLRALEAEYVSVLLGEDGGSVGDALATALGYSVGCLGAALGALSLASVAENIGWPEKFNVLDADNEFDIPAFANGDLVKDNLDKTNGIHDKGYLFMIKHGGLPGTYFTDTPTAIAVTSDYAYIENVRVIQKAIRGIRTYLLPKLLSPLPKEADGLLERSTQSFLETLAGKALNQMRRNSEISDYEVTIDRDLTSGLNITCDIINVEIARQINVTVGFTLEIA